MRSKTLIIRPRSEVAKRLLCIALATLFLLWPAILNGEAFFNVDTFAYIRGPDRVAMKLLGPHAGLWTPTPMGLEEPATNAIYLDAKGGKPPPMAGRSIYYGVLANLGARTPGFWLTVFVQALVAALSLDMLCRSLELQRKRTFLAVALAATLLTPMAFFADCVMPDAWTSVAILLIAAMAAGAERLSVLDRVFAVALVSYAAIVHTTHLPLLFAMAAAAFALMAGRRWMKSSEGRPGLAAAAALAAVSVGVLAGAAFTLGVEHAYGQPPIQPPFLTAHLIADGRPGEPWLREHCKAKPFRACDFVSRLPMSSDDFLWSIVPPKSAFSTSSPEEQSALGKEQFAFATKVLSDDPVGVVRDLLSDGAAQFLDMGLADFNYQPNTQKVLRSWDLGPNANALKASMAYRQAWPIGLMDAVEAVAFTTAAAGLLGLIIVGRGWVGQAALMRRYRVLSAAAVIGVAIAANAFICGDLSDVFGRYQARVAGPFIIIGLIALASVLTRPKDASAEDGATR